MTGPVEFIADATKDFGDLLCSRGHVAIAPPASSTRAPTDIEAEEGEAVSLVAKRYRLRLLLVQRDADGFRFLTNAVQSAFGPAPSSWRVRRQDDHVVQIARVTDDLMPPVERLVQLAQCDVRQERRQRGALWDPSPASTLQKSLH